MKNKIIKFFLSSVVLLLLVVSISGVVNGITFNKNYSPHLVEMRGVWVSTLSNIDVQKQKGTSEEAINEWKKQYLEIIDNAKLYNLNTIIFQVRPNNDAFYPSAYNPWSEYLAGYGVDPGWDPLEWMIEVTHEAGLEYHAWLNPYRTSTFADFDFKGYENKLTYLLDYSETELDKSKTNYFNDLKSKAFVNGKDYDNPIFSDTLVDDVVLGAEDKYVLNPASENVIKHLENTINEIIDNYDIDGIHFDDYFYPNDINYKGSKSDYKGYTYSVEPYREKREYNKYLSNGGTLSLYNWRRENVNTLIKNLSDIIREKNQTKEVKCAFGISPCAGYAPDESCGDRGVEGGMSGSCGMYSAYADLYADTRKWALEEWIDYITPQCYSRLNSGYIGYVSWWSQTLKNSKTKLYYGQGLYQIEEWYQNDSQATIEMYNQIRYNQDNGFEGDGYFFFTYNDLVQTKTGNGNKNAIALSELSTSIWKRNTLTPIYDVYEYKSTVTGNLKINSIVENNDNTLTISFEGLSDAKAYILEEYENDISEIDFNDDSYINVFYGETGTFTPKEGKKYVLAPIAKNNVVQQNYVEIDLNMVKKNTVPEVVIDEIPSEVLKKTTLDLVINIIDDDSFEFSYNIYISRDDSDFSLVDSGTTTNKTITYSWSTYLIAQNNIVFKVTVSDGKDSTTVVSNSFDVVESLTKKFTITYNLDGGTNPFNAPSIYVKGVGIKNLPTPTKDGYVFDGWLLNGEKVSSISASQTGNIELTATYKKEKKGCFKSSAEYMIETLSLVSLLVLIIRKK